MPGFLSAILRRFHGALGLSCPLCLVAILAGVALGGVSFGAILLDRVRTMQQADLAARNVADIARQRAADLLTRIDGTLHAVEEALPGADASPAKLARLDTLLSQRRRVEPRVVGLYVLGEGGAVLSGSVASTLRSGALVPACLRDERPEVDQFVLKPATAALPDGASVPVLCVIRGIRQPGFSGAILAVVGQELLQSQFADLAIGSRGAVTLMDENGRPLARVTNSREAAGDSQRAGEWEALARGAAPDAAAGGTIESRRIDGPIGGIVAVSVAAEDALAAWWSRTLLVGSSALIVIAFVALAVLAVRKCEQRETRRLERLAAMAAELYGTTDRDALMCRLLEGARELVPCEAILPREDRRPPEQAVMRPLLPVIARADLVRIGAVAFQRRHGTSFTPADLAFLAVLASITETGIRHAAVVAEAADEAERFRDSAGQTRQAVETILLEMSDATFTLDVEWRFVGSNRNADRLFGEYAEDLRGRPIWDVFPELCGSTFEAECRRAVRDRHPVSFELQWLRTDTWLMAHAYPRAPGLVVYMQDISRQVAADDKLRQAAKMDAIGRLTGGIAHDFNNLLTVILGNIEMLDLELPESGDARDMHDQIKRAAQSAAELTHQLLAFARRQPLSPVDVDVARLVFGLDGLLRRTLDASIALDIRCPPALWQARVDPTQLENAILNLAINARDAMPQGGRLVIETANLSVRKPDIDQFGEIRPGNYVVVSVSDTGVGIPRDVLAKVFEPFFSTKPPGRGTGLGLSMVYGFVSQSGGHARMTSEVGRGTTVRLYLPGVGEARAEHGLPAPGAGRSRGAEPSLPGGRERILIVEDSDMVRDYALSVLASLGYDVTVAAEGREALALIDKGLQPELLLTDVLLPNGMDGLVVAEQVLRRRPGIPVLYMSGYVENVDAHQSQLDPQTNLLLKPFRRASLAAMVRTRLDRARAK
nr:ATP-binding protein [Limobrevibacterium gyesilva]